MMQPRQRIELPANSGQETSASETSSDEEELDEVEELLREEQLRQKYRQKIAEAKDQQYTAAFLRKFVEAEAVKSSDITGITMVRFHTALGSVLSIVLRHSQAATIPTSGLIFLYDLSVLISLIVNSMCTVLRLSGSCCPRAVHRVPEGPVPW